MKKGLLLIILVGAALVSLPIIGSNTTKNRAGDDLAQQWDRFNLLIPKEAVYVKTADQYGQRQAHGDYLYTQTAYRADGSHYQIIFQAPQQLKANHYLKIDAKGRFVSAWQAIPQTELPTKVQAILK